MAILAPVGKCDFGFESCVLWPQRDANVGGSLGYSSSEDKTRHKWDLHVRLLFPDNQGQLGMYSLKGSTGVVSFGGQRGAGSKDSRCWRAELADPRCIAIFVSSEDLKYFMC